MMTVRASCTGLWHGAGHPDRFPDCLPDMKLRFHQEDIARCPAVAFPDRGKAQCRTCGYGAWTCLEAILPAMLKFSRKTSGRGAFLEKTVMSTCPHQLMGRFRLSALMPRMMLYIVHAAHHSISRTGKTSRITPIPPVSAAIAMLNRYRTSPATA